MIITEEILDKLELALSLRGIKDTHFNYARFPLSMKEAIPIVQEGQNRLIDMPSLANSLLLHSDIHFVNISFTEDGKIIPYNLEGAITSIPENNHRIGQVITFFDSTTKQWVVYQFKGTDINQFQDTDYWEKLLPVHFKGLFGGEEALLNKVPYPELGDYAYVRIEDPNGYFLYQCNEPGKWENMGELASLITEIELSGDLSISDRNTWVIDGTDTGISIYPRKIYWEQITDRPVTWEDLDKMLEGDHIFSLKDHTHNIGDLPGLKDILDEYAEELSNKSDKEHHHDERYSNINHTHDDRYAKVDIDSAVRNMMDSEGRPLFNPDGIVIPKSSGGGGGGGGGTGSCDIDIITTGDKRPPTNENVFSSLKSLSTFLRKDRPDSTEHKMGFLDGITVGDFLDSLKYGRGAAVDKEGNAQFESIEVRGYLKVLELIYNRLNAVEGDQVFTDSGIIEEVIHEDKGELTLKLRRRWEGDFTSFQKDDVIRGVVNKLDSSGEYFTAWARITDVDRPANIIKVVSYSNSEVPAKQNFPLTEDMVIHRWGNATDKDRQSTWYISSTEGRIVFLTGVTKPILEDYNYASFWGKPIPLKIFEGKPINMDHPYAYMRGLLVQDLIRVDYNGVPIKTIVNKGPWKKGEIYNDGSKPPYIQHDVYHNGVIWRCVVDNATEEPKFNSSQWSVMSDNTRFGLELFTDAPLFYRANTSFNYDIEAKVFHGKEEITDKIRDIDWRWYRTTGDISADNRWNMLHENSRNIISLTEDDLGDPQSGITTFKCEVFIKDGEIDYKISKKIIL